MHAADRLDDAQVRSDLWSTLCALAARLGDGDAVLAPGRRALTFAGLRNRIAAIKEDLNRAGIGRGDRVAIVLPNGAEMAVCCVGTIACAVAAPLNPAYTADEFRTYFRRIRPRALIIATDQTTPAREVASELGVPILDLVAETSGPAGTFTLRGAPTADCRDPEWNTGEDLGYVLLTSGTTSEQKLVPVKQKQLMAYALGIQPVLGIGPADRTLLIMPLYHGAGLKSSCLIPLVNCASVVCLPEFEVSTFFEAMDTYRPTWITAGFTFHKAILEKVDAYRDIVQRSRLRFMRSGAGRLDPKVKEGLESAFGVPVIEQYSSSETGVIAISPLPPEKGKPGAVGRPVFNEVAVMGADGALLEPGAEGEIVVRGPSVFDGYLDDPEANGAAFINGWYRTGDLGRLDTDRFLTITGRVKEIINRGGEKISPREIEAVLSRHDAVLDVKAFGVPHRSLGEEVVAAAVVRSDIPLSEMDLKKFASEHLADFKVPRRIFFRDALPLGPSQKLDVRTLVRECRDLLDAEREATKGASHRELSPTESVVCDLWRQTLGDERIGIDSDFSLLSGDSLKAVELLISVEKVFGIELPMRALNGEASTVAKMAAEVDRLRGQPVSDRNAADETKTIDVSDMDSPPARSRPILTASDVLTSLVFLSLAPVAWFLPRSAWSSVCGALARLHVAARGSHTQGIGEALSKLRVRLTPRELEHRFLSRVYEDIVCTLREHLPFAWRPRIRLEGAKNVRAARAAGLGAILWVCPSPFGGFIAKKALKAEGFDLVSLRSAIHPYSGSRFGTTVLNPMRTRVEDRYLMGTVILRDGDGLAGLHALRQHLDANAIVTIAANAQEGVPFELPFLGGTLELSLGAPMLSVLRDTPLLPVFTSRNEKGKFEVVIGPRIQAPPEGNPNERARELARCYASALEEHLRHHPAEWRGWFSRNAWRPGIEM
ncbi:MAG: AMP-binding protein [Burkholderiales bacterium]